MYTVVRQYSGQGAAQIFGAIEGKKDEVERLIRGEDLGQRYGRRQRI